MFRSRLKSIGESDCGQQLKSSLEVTAKARNSVNRWEFECFVQDVSLECADLSALWYTRGARSDEHCALRALTKRRQVGALQGGALFDRCGRLEFALDLHPVSNLKEFQKEDRHGSSRIPGWRRR